jgi:serine/threonine protein kinase
VIVSCVFWQDDFVPGKKLGEGAFGVVYKASLTDPKAAEKVNTEA